MAGRLKFKPTMFLVFDYDREETYINSMADQGWQLKKGGLFHHTYERNDQNYRYKLDFNTKVKMSLDEYERYQAFFREQGWELVNSTINGWHYFRKKYSPEADPEDYCIYTDDISLKEMLARWNRIAIVLQVALFFCLIYNLVIYFYSKMAVAGIASLMSLLCMMLMQLCIVKMRQKRLNGKPYSSPWMYSGYILLGAILITFVLMIYLSYQSS